MDPDHKVATGWTGSETAADSLLSAKKVNRGHSNAKQSALMCPHCTPQSMPSYVPTQSRVSSAPPSAQGLHCTPSPGSPLHPPSKPHILHKRYQARHSFSYPTSQAESHTKLLHLQLSNGTKNNSPLKVVFRIFIASMFSKFLPILFHWL